METYLYDLVWSQRVCLFIGENGGGGGFLWTVKPGVVNMNECKEPYTSFQFISVY